MGRVSFNPSDRIVLLSAVIGRFFLCTQVVEAGANGVCAIGALYKSTDPAATARALLQAMTDAKQTGGS